VLKEIVITVKNDKLVSDEMTQECDEWAHIKNVIQLLLTDLH
jgi:hypothetical protein